VASVEPDWPQWRGPRRDGISKETGLMPNWPEGGPRQVWKIEHLGRGWSSPILVGERIYVTGDIGEDLVIFAFDLDGKPVWQVKNGAAWTGSYNGARACCVYSEGKLYHMNSHGRVACFDATSGKEYWACDIQKQFESPEITWGFSECLLVDGRQLIVTPGAGKALMAALDKQTGKTLWMTPPLGEDRAAYASPSLFQYGNRRIVANSSSHHGFGVDANSGKLLWTVPLHNQYGVNITTPVFGQGQIFYVTAYDFGACYQLHNSESGVEATKIWNTTLDTCAGAVLLLGDRLYGSGYEKHRSWLCLDWKSGQTVQEFKEMKIGSAVFADGRFYCLAEDSHVAMAKPTPEGMAMVSQFQLLPEKIRDAWAHPILLHGRLYLRYHDALWCYDVRGK
jgi:outer membrane protein assembly factor BamB